MNHKTENSNKKGSIIHKLPHLVRTSIRLLSHAALPAAMLIASGTTQAAVPTDFEIQSSRMTMSAYEANLNDSETQYIKSLIAKDYPTPSIILHAIGRGLPINDIVYHLVKADPDRGLQIYQQATSLLPSLPGWVCEQSVAANNRFYQHYSAAELGSAGSVTAVAERYFTSNARLKDTGSDKGDLNINIDELIELASNETAAPSGDAWWYLSMKNNPASSAPVFVSLYRNNSQIVIDADLNTLQQRKASGASSVPVEFIYNAENLLPTSQVESAVANAMSARIGSSSLRQLANGKYIDVGDGNVSVSEVLYLYTANNLRITPPREWRELDHHVQAQTSELMELFPVPNQADIPKKRWNSIATKLQSSGFEKPVLITVYGDSNERWIDDAEWIAVANTIGTETVPVVFFFHETERYTCDSPAACGASICGSALAAGAKIGTCKGIKIPPPNPPPPPPGSNN